MALVYEKGIVVLPKHVRKMAGIHKGMKISFKVEDKRVIIEAENDWLIEFENIKNEISKSTGKDVGKRIKIAQERYANRFKHVY